KGDPPATASRVAKSAPASGQAVAAKSRIVKVTVYPANALVTREVDVPPGGGLTELVVPDLPVRVQDRSLYSEGSDGIRVLSTRFRQRPVEEDTREEVRKLEDEKKKLLLASQKLEAELKSISQNMALLNKLEDFTKVT